MQQINDWEKAGNPGWNWDNLFPYYLKSEQFVEPDASQVYGGATFLGAVHGTEGPVNTGWSVDLVPSPKLIDVMRETGENIGLPAIDDPNGGYMRGTSTFPRTIYVANGSDVREDSYTAYIEPLQGRTNLDILTETSALRIIWADQEDGGNVTAAGVEIAPVASNASSVIIKATKEVILSAGAYRSSSILEFSGAGNPTILEPLDIDVVIDLPGVGEHLMDQPENTMGWKINSAENFTTGKTGYVVYANATDFWGDEVSAVAADLLAALPDYAATIASQNSGAATADAIEAILKIQYESIFQSQTPFTELLANLQLSTGGISHQFWVTTPFSQGSVHINTTTPPTDGSIPIDITNRFFQLEWDVTAHVAAARFLRKLYGTAPLNGTAIVAENNPGWDATPLNATDDEWMEWVKKS